MFQNTFKSEKLIFASIAVFLSFLIFLFFIVTLFRKTSTPSVMTKPAIITQSLPSLTKSKKEEWLLYTDPSFRLAYPPDWTVTPHTLVHNGLSLTFRPKILSSVDQVPVITVEKVPVSQTTTFDRKAREYQLGYGLTPSASSSSTVQFSGHVQYQLLAGQDATDAIRDVYIVAKDPNIFTIDFVYPGTQKITEYENIFTLVINSFTPY